MSIEFRINAVEDHTKLSVKKQSLHSDLVIAIVKVENGVEDVVAEISLEKGAEATLYRALDAISNPSLV